MKNTFEEQYLDVLHNIEFAIVQISREHTAMLDINVKNALEALIRDYKAEAANRSVSPSQLSDLEQNVYESVKATCEWRLGRVEMINKDNQPLQLLVKLVTVAEIINCLKRVHRSVRYWSKRSGRRGYLEFVKQFIV
ncbi:MAG: hypothetical protein JXB07_15135 [Anaerolineae bacterium]|nr:hypothetical protein [Anaerolineae bacterium]